MNTEIEHTDQQGKAMFTGRSPRHTQATTAGHTEGTQPKAGVGIRAAKGEEGHVMCGIIKLKRAHMAIKGTGAII
jgi:hypothetical protein